MLSVTHRPYICSWPICSISPRYLINTLNRDTCNIRNPLWRPLFCFFLYFIHPIHALLDKFLIFPSVFEDKVQNTINEWYVCSWPYLRKEISLCRCFCVPWINNYYNGIVPLLSLKYILETNGMCHCWV